MLSALGQLDLERRTLPNGLRIVLHHDPSLPLVAINLWYHVGSKHEKPGRTGFAHLFEHLLFQGSEHVDTNDHFRLVQLAGGVANGSTWFDRTNYYETLPAHQLDLGLWLESDRMGWFLSAITQEKLDNQREVVINERRQKIDNQPYGRAFERLHELLYPEGHPYSWPVIGYIEDLAAANLEDVRRFFATYYVPNNAVLTLAGDFDRDHAHHQIEHHFGEIPRGRPLKAVDIPKPEIAEAKRDNLPDRVSLSRIYIGFHGPPYGSRMWYAGDLLATALADGKSSPLYKDLVYERQLAHEIGCFILPTEESATFALIATARPGVALEDLEARIDQHLHDLTTALMEPEHLERACNRLLTAYYNQIQTLDRRADLISRFTTFFDQPERSFEEADLYLQLTPSDLMSFARTYCRLEQRAVVTITPRD